MANIAYFEIPADNVGRAKKFYHELLGWTIGPTKTPMDPSMLATVQYQDITTGKTQEGTLSTGGMYKRQMAGAIMSYVIVEDIDKVLTKAVLLGGNIVVPKMEIPSFGEAAVIRDTEGNTIGFWKPVRK
jgi:predicted enzyme related to lactoylglutathione lyase